MQSLNLPKAALHAINQALGAPTHPPRERHQERECGNLEFGRDPLAREPLEQHQ